MTGTRVRAAATGVSVALLTLAAATPAVAAKRTQLRHSASPAASRTPQAGSIPGSTKIGFQVDLKLRHARAAAKLGEAVSTPGNRRYGHFMTAKQWEARFSPSKSSVAKVKRFLRKEGFSVGQASADRMEVAATGTASRIESVFATRLSLHKVEGQVVRLADTNLSVPARLGGTIAGVTGVSQTLAQPAKKTSGGGSTPSTTGGFPPPAGYRSAPQCSSYFGGPIGTPSPEYGSTLPDYGNGYPSNPPWAVCGYTGPQLRTAYGITGDGTSGSGATVAIVDAYAAPTLKSDLQQYISDTDPTHPLGSTQFSENVPHSYTLQHTCTNNGWYGEQSLDVEAVHNMAPAAHILFVGAQSCSNADLNAALRKIVDGGLAQVISNSWGTTGGDQLESASDRQATDQILQMAEATGISVLFSSGDNGDDFTTLDRVAADYPASSPYATAVGGTTLGIAQNGTRSGEWGWSTARSFLCNSAYESLGGCTSDQLNTWMPIDPTLDGGSGGGTSVSYPQSLAPYQAGVVPTSLSEAGGTSQPMRVEPDISMDADPGTGMLVGETQAFPDGVKYDTYRLGGTSLASPLFAGLLANAIQANGGKSFGLVNPALYGATSTPGALHDVGPTPVGGLDQSRADFANSIDASQGYLYTTRIIDYEGSEAFCPSNGPKSGPDNGPKKGPNGVCTPGQVALHTAAGYDNMTGLGSAGPGLVAALAGK